MTVLKSICWKIAVMIDIVIGLLLLAIAFVLWLAGVIIGGTVIIGVCVTVIVGGLILLPLLTIERAITNHFKRLRKCNK